VSTWPPELKTPEDYAKFQLVTQIALRKTVFIFTFRQAMRIASLEAQSKAEAEAKQQGAAND